MFSSSLRIKYPFQRTTFGAFGEDGTAAFLKRIKVKKTPIYFYLFLYFHYYLLYDEKTKGEQIERRGDLFYFVFPRSLIPISLVIFVCYIIILLLFFFFLFLFSMACLILLLKRIMITSCGIYYFSQVFFSFFSLPPPSVWLFVHLEWSLLSLLEAVVIGCSSLIILLMLIHRCLSSIRCLYVCPILKPAGAVSLHINLRRTYSIDTSGSL